jgi:hypothetical protein
MAGGSPRGTWLGRAAHAERPAGQDRCADGSRDQDQGDAARIVLGPSSGVGGSRYPNLGSPQRRAEKASSAAGPRGNGMLSSGPPTWSRKQLGPGFRCGRGPLSTGYRVRGIPGAKREAFRAQYAAGNRGTRSTLGEQPTPGQAMHDALTHTALALQALYEFRQIARSPSPNNRPLRSHPLLMTDRCLGPVTARRRE